MAGRLTTYLVVAIVGATLIAGLIVGAQRNDTEGPIDIIVHNAVVYTADASGTTAEALAIRGNQVLRVGSDREIMRLQRPQTVVIDARGAAVLPGFNDSNVQPIAGGLALETIDLAGAEDLAEAAARINAWAVANPDRPWVIGRAWDSAVLPQGTTPRQWLDAEVPDRPAAMMSADGATAWANSKALQVVMTESASNPEALKPKGSRTAESSGLLTGADLERLEAAQPRASRAAQAAAFRAAVAEAHRLGITSLQDLTASAQDLELYGDARRDGELGVRIYGGVTLAAGTSEAEVARLEAIANKYPDDPMLKAGAVTLAVDGTSAAGTAAMLQPLPGKADAVPPLIAPDDLNRLVRLVDARGWQVVLHAAGDRAVRMALDAFEHAARSNAAPSRGRRHRLEGVQAIDAADVPRLKTLDVIVAMNTPAPVNAASTGARLIIGSRWPSGPLNPLVGIQALVAGTNGEDAVVNAGAAARLTLKRALNATTSSTAYASFDEHRKGTLKAGMLADLVILTADIFSIPPSRIGAVDVSTTIFDGRIVYQRDKRTFP